MEPISTSRREDKARPSAKIRASVTCSRAQDMTITSQPLSQSQNEAISAPWRGTVNVILSTAGSGKTLTLTKRAVWIAQQLVLDRVPSARLLCVCFNKSAAEEMFERIRMELVDLKLENDVFVTSSRSSLFDKVTIEVRTFHALGLWVLHIASPNERNSVGLGSGNLTVLKGKELNALALEALTEAREVQPNLNAREANKVARKAAQRFSESKRALCDARCEAGFSGKEDIVSTSQTSRALQVFQERMKERNGIDYSDMIGKAIELSTNHERIRSKLESRFQAVLVDEFQDMSPSNFALCKAFVDKTRSLTVVGDDDQRIYSFRSSLTWVCHDQIANSFRRESKIFRLPENRRCPGAIVKSANALIRKNLNRYEKGMTPTQSDGTPMRIVGCKSKALEIQFVTDRIKALLPIARRNGHQVLVLFRINALLGEFQKSFRAAGIQTSSTILTTGAAETLGPRTLSVYGLILLLSKSISKETFLWAATIVSPTLEREALQKILDHAEHSQATNETSHYATEEFSHNPQAAAYSSPFVDKLAKWFREHRDSQTGMTSPPDLHAIRTLLAYWEHLREQARSLSSLEDLVEFAGVILPPDSAVGEIPETISSQQSDYGEKRTAGDDNAGFSYLVKAASAIDKTWKEDVPHCKIETGPDDDDVEDFSSLFSRDDHSRAQKRRKTMGVRQKAATPSGKRDILVGKLEKLHLELNDLLSTSTSEKTKTMSSSRRIHCKTVLSTIHRAKGAQAAYVFLCGADKYNIPNGAGRRLNMGMRVDMHSPEIEEERRMFFVSLTRTQKEFTCTYSVPTEPNARPEEDIRSWRSPFLEELCEGVEGEKGCVSESFIHNEDDIKTVVQNLQQSTM